VEPKSLQETYSPNGTCFGCGPKNDKGLRIRSFVDGTDGCICRWTAQPHHQAFPGFLSGGITGAILDCHANWTAAWALMRASGVEVPPCTVTAEFSVKLRRPTPLAGELVLRSKIVDARGDRATIEASLEAEGKVTATLQGLFAAVREGHPAFHRW
jgi:acyl-coenzyme A thioesterase PaaI-like protein